MSDTPAPFSFAIVGCSSIADSHIRTLRKIPNVRVTHVYSRSSLRANCFANKFGVIPIKNLSSILENSSIDAILIATDPGRHAIYGCEAINSGKHVLIEKPLALNLKDGARLVEQSRLSNATTSIISQYRYDDVLTQLAAQITTGKLGEPFLIQASLIWQRQPEYFSKGDGWRGAAADVLTNQGIHLVDFILSIFGEPTSSVVTTSNVSSYVSSFDTATLSMKFAKPLIGTISCTTASPVSKGIELKVLGTKALIECHDRGGHFVFNYKAGVVKDSFLRVVGQYYQRQKKPLIQRQLEDFVLSARQGTAPRVSIQDGYRALQVILGGRVE